MSEDQIQKLQAQYNQLCMQLGDTEYKIEQLQAHKKSLTAQLDKLNELYRLQASEAKKSEEETSEDSNE